MTPARRRGEECRGRPDRKCDHPEFPLETVVRLAENWFVYFTGRAEQEGARFLRVDEIHLKGLVCGLLRGVTLEEWRFRQLKDGRWVDVYRVELEDTPPIWIKLRLETMKQRDVVMIITLHEYEE